MHHLRPLIYYQIPYCFDETQLYRRQELRAMRKTWIRVEQQKWSNEKNTKHGTEIENYGIEMGGSKTKTESQTADTSAECEISEYPKNRSQNRSQNILNIFK